MIAFPCPKCKATLKAPEDKAGAHTKCPRCGCPLLVPASSATAGPVAVPVIAQPVGGRPAKAKVPRATAAPEPPDAR
jgi:hypothetical protein